jgi:hypothetical protein
MKPMLNSSVRAFDGMASAQPSTGGVALRTADAMRTSHDGRKWP